MPDPHVAEPVAPDVAALAVEVEGVEGPAVVRDLGPFVGASNGAEAAYARRLRSLPHGQRRPERETRFGADELAVPLDTERVERQSGSGGEDRLAQGRISRGRDDAAGGGAARDGQCG